MLMSVILVVAQAVTAAPQPADDASMHSELPAWRLDFPVSLTATTPTTGVHTELTPWVGLRVGRLWDATTWASGWSIGAELAVHVGGIGADGTSDVATARTFAGAEGRVRGSPWRMRNTFSAFEPYAFASVLGGAGRATKKLWDDVRRHNLSTWAVHGGGGLELVTHGACIRAELAAGVRDARPQLWSSMSVGVAF